MAKAESLFFLYIIIYKILGKEEIRIVTTFPEKNFSIHYYIILFAYFYMIFVFFIFYAYFIYIFLIVDEFITIYKKVNMYKVSTK